MVLASQQVWFIIFFLHDFIIICSPIIFCVYSYDDLVHNVLFIYEILVILELQS